MKRRGVGVAGTILLLGFLLWSSKAWALTVLEVVTPKNINGGTFRLTARAAHHHRVEFVIRRDVRKVTDPGRSGYLSHPATDGNRLGTPLKLEEHDKTFTFRFSVPEDQVPGSVFTLWGYGEGGEGVTFEFHLGQFWKPGKE